MRVVGREQRHLVAGVGDDPAGVFVRVGRDAQLPLHEFAGLGRQLLQPGLVAHEGMGGRIHRPHPARHPGSTQFDRAPFQPREAVEHAVEDQRGQGLHHRVRDGHVADRGEVVVATVEIGHRGQAVELVDRVDLLLAADMEQHRDAGLLRLRPHGIQRDMAGAVPLRAFRRHHQRLGAEPDGQGGRGRRAVEVFQRHVGGGQQAAVDRAERGHHAVVRVGGGVAQRQVVALVEAEVAEAEGGEHQLAGEPQQVQRVRPVGGDEGAMGLVVLAQQEVAVDAGAEGRIGMGLVRAARPQVAAQRGLVTR